MSAEQTILEEAIDIVEDQAEVVVESVSLLRRIIWNHKTHVTVAFVAGAGVGSAVTYKVAKEKLERMFEVQLDEELAKTKEYYDRKYMVGDYADPSTALKKLHPEAEIELEGGAIEAHSALADYRGETVENPPETDEDAEELIRQEIAKGKKKNIFDNAPEPFDWEAEMAHREAISDSEPYIITLQEYTEDADFDEIALTYYEGDGVLTTPDDQVVHDVQGTIGGLENLRFGYGSEDGNIVYIRNPRTQSNMEVVRSENSYEVEVLGVDPPELKHSQRRPRRFREYDE